jgi:hypothetical protein
MWELNTLGGSVNKFTHLHKVAKNIFIFWNFILIDETKQNL